MRILFVHQNFPGQYVHIVQRLARMGDHQMVALGINALDANRPLPESLQFFRYPLERGNTETTKKNQKKSKKIKKSKIIIRKKKIKKKSA